jgi:rare lipoprotein A
VPQHKPANNSTSLLAISLVACLALTGCAAVPLIAPEPQDGPGVPVDTSNIKDPVPKAEPITKAGNKSPYTVFGKTYFVLPSNKDYREQGVASWYGKKFHGRKTSNGEVYDMYAMTAAHKTLPIPTYVRVTHSGNKRSIIVRINDRGPFHGPRIIDLSYVAALKLGFADTGTAEVLVETIDLSGSLDRPEPPAEPKAVSSNRSPDQRPARQLRHLIRGAICRWGPLINCSRRRCCRKKFAATPATLFWFNSEIFSTKSGFGPISDQLELQLIKQVLKQSANVTGFMVNH